MSRYLICIACAVVAGIAAVCFLPPDWIGPLAEAGGICFAILAIIVRINTRTQAPTNAMVKSVLQLLNLPEQPLAKVKEGWALTSMFVSAAFLVSLALAVMMRATN